MPARGSADASGAQAPRGRAGLLGAVARDALEPGRAAAGTRRPARRRAARAGSTLAVALAGLVTALAALAGSGASPGRARLTAALTAERDQRAAAVAARSPRVAALRAAVASQRAAADAADADRRGTAAALAALRPDAAAVPATGPGIRLEIRDTRDGPVAAGPRGAGEPGTGGLTDRDLAALVNALFGGGAGAVAVNGVRLSATGGIRAAGSAILVGFQPVASPYRIEATGDPRRLLAAFYGCAVGRRLADDAHAGARLDASSVQASLTVPPAPVPTLRAVRSLSS